jgi:hypothetical protein
LLPEKAVAGMKTFAAKVRFIETQALDSVPIARQ